MGIDSQLCRVGKTARDDRVRIGRNAENGVDETGNGDRRRQRIGCIDQNIVARFYRPLVERARHDDAAIAAIAAADCLHRILWIIGEAVGRFVSRCGEGQFAIAEHRIGASAGAEIKLCFGDAFRRPLRRRLPLIVAHREIADLRRRRREGVGFALEEAVEELPDFAIHIHGRIAKLAVARLEVRAERREGAMHAGADDHCALPMKFIIKNYGI